MLFDYDGVIVDSFDCLLGLCVRAQAEMGCGRPPVCQDLRTIENLSFAELGRLIGVPEGRVGAYAGRILALQKTHWPVAFVPGMAGVLSDLARRHTVAVITASDSETVAASLRKGGVGAAVAAVLGGELGTGKAERIATIRARYGISCGDAWMTGDAISDIREGKRAGVGTIAVAWGYQDRALLANEQPDFLIDSPSDLLRIASGEARPPRGRRAAPDGK